MPGLKCVLVIFSLWFWLLPDWNVDDGTLPLPRGDDLSNVEEPIQD